MRLRRGAGLAGLILCAMAAFAPQASGQESAQKTFRIGIVAEPGAGTAIEGLSELSEAYGKVLGTQVEFFVARNYPALIDAHASARIDYAIYRSASAYAAAYRRCECLEPLVAPAGGDGSTGIRSVLITRDGRLDSATDLAGRRIALAPADSMAGNRMPLALFRPDGRPLSGEESFLVKAQSAEEAEAMFVDGTVDAMFGWAPAVPSGRPEPEGGTLARVAAAGVDPSTLGILWHSEPLRYGPHAVSAGLDPEPRRRLTRFLTGLKRADPDMYERLERQRLGGFAAVTQADYAVALEVVDAIAAVIPGDR